MERNQASLRPEILACYERSDRVLLLGLVYQLQEQSDRLATLREARQVVRVGEEIERSDLVLDGVVPTEGPPWLLGNLEEWLDEPNRLEHLLWALRQVEREPSLLAASGHLLALARRRSD